VTLILMGLLMYVLTGLPVVLLAFFNAPPAAYIAWWLALCSVCVVIAVVVLRREPTRKLES
jgi:hypothetical protein